VRFSYLSQPVGGFLDELAAGTPAPGAGCAAALVVAQSAALCAMAARLSARKLPAERVDRLVSESEKVRSSAASLVELDALAYLRVIEATRAANASTPAAPEQAAALANALSQAADVPLQVVELGARAARLASVLATEGNQALRGEAITAKHLAQASARAAAALVRINLAGTPDDPRLKQVGELLAEAES
jgi:methenyltetrahydrofolate cyclohydrolase